MKKAILLLMMMGAFTYSNAQHDYDEQGVIYSTTDAYKNVGVGTNSPSQKFHVRGNILTNQLNDSEDYDEIGIMFKSGFPISQRYSLSIFNLEEEDLGRYSLGVNGYNGIFFNTGKVDGRQTRMLVTETGEVGVGTETPTSLLEVNGKTTSQTALINPDANDGFMLQMGKEFDGNRRHFNFTHNSASSGFTGFSVLTQRNELTDAPDDLIDEGDTGDGFAELDTPNYITRLQFSAKSNYTALGIKDVAGYEVFKAAKSNGIGNYVHMPYDNSRMVIGKNGGYRLSEGYKLVVANGDMMVEGRLDADEVKVELHTPPDYVFQKYFTGTSELNPNYDMPSLEEVEAFVEKNHHLPEVPSAKEIQEEGLKLKEMTAILLQKIEELTLYNIEQEKRIKALEAKLENKQN